MKPTTVRTIPAFLEAIEHDYAEWRTKAAPWFRGEPENVETPLLPTLYRGPKNASQDYDENDLLQSFRRYAPIRFDRAPGREHTDDWLFHAQHFRLPTRLLDWSEGALVALYFALEESCPVVWMLNPLALIEMTAPDAKANAYPLTWFAPTGTVANVGVVNIQAAWGDPKHETALPVPIHPTITHARMAAQLSCFTIFGKRRESLSTMVDEKCLRFYRIDADCKEEARRQLRAAGIRQATLFPDAENLALDLEQIYRVPRTRE